MPSLIEQLEAADAQAVKQRSAHWAELSEIVWRSDKPLKGDAGASLKLVDALNAGLEAKDPRFIDRAKLAGWILAVQKIRSLEPTAADLAARQERLSKHEKKAAEFDANRRRIIANLERDREQIIGEGRAAKALVDAGQSAARQIAELTDELGVAFGQIDVAARNRRRHLVQVAFGRPKNAPFEVIEFESVMTSPGGWTIEGIERYDFQPVDGQTPEALDELKGRAVVLVRRGLPAWYLTGQPESDFARKDATLWGFDPGTFQMDGQVFEPLPGQDAADLEKRIEAIRRAVEAARKLRSWEGVSRGPEPRPLNYAETARAG